MGRIVVVCPGCGGIGAVANVAKHQARELGKAYSVVLLSDSLPAEPIAGVKLQQVRLPSFNWLRRFAHVPNELAFALAVYTAMLRLHRATPLDAILCHGHAVGHIACGKLKRNQGIPFAMVTHGDIFDRPKGTYDSRLTRFYRWVTPGAYREAKLVVTLSPHMCDMAIRGGAEPGKVAIIPNGIEPEEIGLGRGTAITPRPNPDSGLELLFVGRLSVEKGIDVLIRACGVVKARGVRFHLRIAGDGPQRANLEYERERLGLKDVVSFIGAVARCDLGRLYRSSHLVCVPSRSDPLPTVVLEAMVAGVPVLGSDAGGIPFMVVSGRTGWIVPVGDPPALADLVTELANNPGSTIAMEEKIRHRAAEEFSWERQGERLRDSLQLMLGR